MHKEENFDCRAVETLILDEADRMLDMGFAQDIEHIAGETRWRKQTLLFRQLWKAMRFRTLPSVCWKIRWRFLPIRPHVSAKIHQWYYRADDRNIKPHCWCIC
ncbi:DEAD/DEAH box helicase [Escherichia coli]|nr:DEAD/DEAH box helicase [Escherichia coli]